MPEKFIEYLMRWAKIIFLLYAGGWFINVVDAHLHPNLTKKKVAKKKHSNINIIYNKILKENLKVGHDVVTSTMCKHWL